MMFAPPTVPFVTQDPTDAAHLIKTGSQPARCWLYEHKFPQSLKKNHDFIFKKRVGGLCIQNKKKNF